tara:strand:- start:221 stop:1060 length:840 start_codon:yes stop_codon:yes gene_type:complete
MNIKNAIKKANSVLEKNNIKSSILDSEILMSEAVKKDRKFVILNPEKNLKPKNLDHFFYLIKERSKGKPVAYLNKKKEFWKYEFKIEKDVLIPRPDTELIIEETLRITKNKTKLRVLDIGVGSGCILLSVLKEKKDFYGVGVDISKKCLDLCKKNSLKLGLKKRVKLFKSDIDNFNYGKYDLVLSNPPYINLLDLRYLDMDVNYEPKLALNGGIDGLSNIRDVVSNSYKLLKKNGKLILEIGFDQKNRVKKILKDNGFFINKVLKDYAKKDRCIVSTKL